MIRFLFISMTMFFSNSGIAEQTSISGTCSKIVRCWESNDPNDESEYISKHPWACWKEAVAVLESEGAGAPRAKAAAADYLADTAEGVIDWAFSGEPSPKSLFPRIDNLWSTTMTEEVRSRLVVAAAYSGDARSLLAKAVASESDLVRATAVLHLAYPFYDFPKEVAPLMRRALLDPSEDVVKTALSVIEDRMKSASHREVLDPVLAEVIFDPNRKSLARNATNILANGWLSATGRKTLARASTEHPDPEVRYVAGKAVLRFSTK